MTTTASITKVQPQQVGAFISYDRYLELGQDFQNNFPTEVTSVLLSKIALQTVLADENVSGIRFMNGLLNVNDPSTRILVLMPGNYTSEGNLPNAVIKANGFLTNTGDLISLEQTWEVLFNHVLNFKRIDANTPYTKINRGSFMGRDILNELLNETEGDTLIYNFGYDIENKYPYKTLISDLDVSLVADQSMPCPGSAGCPHVNPQEFCALTRIATTMLGSEAEEQLNILRAFRDTLLQEKLSGSEVEKYYTISASVLEAIDRKPNKQAIFKAVYDQYIKTSLSSLAQNDEATAYLLFQEALDHLTTTYLYQ